MTRTPSSSSSRGAVAFLGPGVVDISLGAGNCDIWIDCGDQLAGQI